MRKFRSTLWALALAAVLVVGGAATASAATPVAPNNTPAAAFPPAQTCSCHSNFIDEWKQSMHGQSMSDPIYKVKLAQGNAATGGKIGPFCITCHGPVATMVGQTASTDPTSTAYQGIGCSFCHQVVGQSAPTGNVSLLLQPSGVYRAQLATPQAPHAVAFSAFHATSAICGSCHNVAHPGNGLPIEATYNEWKASPQAKAGVQCQDCHMSRSPGLIGPSLGWAAGGASLRNVYQMNFIGAQVGLSNATLATQMLQQAATISLRAPGMLEGSTSTSVTVTITNTGAGHDIPTGLTEVRQMWLLVTMTGPDGKTVTVGRHDYGAVLKNAAGKYPVQLWEATGVQSDERIPPMGTSVNTYKITFPEGAQSGILSAQLLYKSVPDDLAKAAKAPNPTTVMAEAHQAVYVNLKGEQQANKAVLAEAASSPLMPLVFAILGLLVSFGLVIFFVWWGRRPAKPTGPKPPAGKSDELADGDDAAGTPAEKAAGDTAAGGAPADDAPGAVAPGPGGVE